MAGSFTLDLQRFAQKATANAHDVVGTVVTQIVTEVDYRSPVKSGRFRGNWQLGVDVEPGGSLAELDPSGAAARNRNFAVVPEEAGGHLYTLTNNLPYAMPLEMGHSRQAPQGIVGLTVAKFQSIVDEAAEALP